ncbi:MAG: fasciclin domain-containing protein [Verrucomicrobiota bacterium]
MKISIPTLLLGAIALVSYAGDDRQSSEKTIVETAVAAGSFETLAAALDAADLVDTLNSEGPFTVFAPTDAAFARLPKGTVEELLLPENKEKLQSILKFHIVEGRVSLSDALKLGKAETVQSETVTIGFREGKVRINDAALQNADLEASNGIIHVIDSVLLPPEPKNDIASVAKQAGQFGTLLAAVEAAGLTSALNGSDPLTVLAPTDAAFKALPKGTVESLLKPENRSKLTEILTLHVIEGSVSAGTALNARSAKSLGDGSLKFEINEGLFQVNGATIVKTDIECDNGIIHVIDAVLLPAKEGVSPRNAEHSATTQMSPAKRIESAIGKGVTVFNHGDHARCAQIYMACAEALTKDHSVGHSTRSMLTKIVNEARASSCSTSQAWILRGGLDHAYHAVR